MHKYYYATKSTYKSQIAFIYIHRIFNTSSKGLLFSSSVVKFLPPVLKCYIPLYDAKNNKMQHEEKNNMHF